MKNALLYFLGYISVFIGASLLIPALVSYHYSEPYTYSFIILGLSVSIIGALVRHFFKRKGFLDFKTVILTVASSWLLTVFLGTLPYLMTGVIKSPIDAFFESMSGFTTTGATILPEITSLPYSILFWRSLTHWIGGMGIILMVIAILPSFGPGMYLFQAEVSGGSINKKISPRIRKTAVLLWAVYIFLTVSEIGLLMLAGLNLYDAAIHTFGTVATGGFSSKNESIGFYDNIYVHYIIILFMFLSGVNFILYCRFILGERKVFFKNTELKFYSMAILIFTAIIAFSLYKKVYPGLEETIRHSLFQVTSIITTTGYITADFDAWPGLAKMLLLLAMFIGGCAGSTGGAMKPIRIYVSLKSAITEVFRTLHPAAVKNIYVDKEPLSIEVIRKITRFFIAYILIFALGSVALSFFNLDMISAMSAAATNLGNVGPGLGLAGATEPYTLFHPAAKLILSALMLIGRLEIFAIVMLFSRSFWRE